MVMLKCTNTDCPRPEKDESEFNLCRSNRRGHQYWCRDCQDKRREAYRSNPAFREKEAASNTRYRKSEHGAKKTRDANRNWRNSPNGVRLRKRPETRFTFSQAQAAERCLEWNIALSEYLVLIESGRCHYCDSEITGTGCGLDRKDNALGYSVQNCVPCCTICNKVKGAHFTYDEMMFLAPSLKAIRGRRISE